LTGSTDNKNVSASRNYSESAFFDPITLEIINSYLTTTCIEMGLTMERTAYSPIFHEGTDFSCALFDSKMELLAQAEGCPAQLGAMFYSVNWSIKELGLENLEPGDVILHNDVYRGHTHIPEFAMIKPVFIDNTLVAFCANIAHHADVGGKTPGSFPADATEVYQEGILIPPVKMWKRAERVDEIWKIILANVRNKNNSYGDFMATYGSLVTAERQLIKLIKRYGLKEYMKYVEEIKNYGERRMRAEIEKIPDGTYESEEFIDDDGITNDMYRISVRITKSGSEMVVDYTGSDKQARGPVNCSYGVTASATYNGIFNFVDPTIPHNQGSFRPIRLICPSGTVVNANFPAPMTGGNSETHNLIANAVLLALGQAVPERAVAEGGVTCGVFTVGGIDPRSNGYFTYVNWDGNGFGARASKDGNNAVVPYVGGQSRNCPVESIETVAPLRVTRYELIQDGGGAGKYRGGLGVLREFEILTEECIISCHSNKAKTGPRGIFGGLDGSRTAFLIKRKEEDVYRTPQEVFGAVSPTKFVGVLHNGDRIQIRHPGGGGYGDPLQRDASKVEEDLVSGYISLKSASEVYELPQRILNKYREEVF